MDENEVVELMRLSNTLAEWGKNCDAVKDKCGGYPPFWYKAIIMSGLADDVAARWGGDAKIHVVGIGG